MLHNETLCQKQTDKTVFDDNSKVKWQPDVALGVTADPLLRAVPFGTSLFSPLLATGARNHSGGQARWSLFVLSFPLYTSLLEISHDQHKAGHFEKDLNTFYESLPL